MKNSQKFSVYVWPNTQKERDGKLAIYMRVFVDSKKATISTRFYVNPNHWDKRANRLKLQAPNHQQINAFIDRSCNLI